jgi:hypothetical protein
MVITPVESDVSGQPDPDPEVPERALVRHYGPAFKLGSSTPCLAFPEFLDTFRLFCVSSTARCTLKGGPGNSGQCWRWV